MKFDLKRPCADCPFRKDAQRGWLGEKRAQEIADAILREDKTFACHKTVHVHEDEVEQDGLDPTLLEEDQAQRQHCAGAIALIEAIGAKNSMLQISERLGIREPGRVDATGRELSFDSEAEFVRRHAGVRA